MSENKKKPPTFAQWNKKQIVEGVVLEHLGKLTKESRVDFFNFLFSRYCKFCGLKLTKQYPQCFCWNDE